MSWPEPASAEAEPLPEGGAGSSGEADGRMRRLDARYVPCARVSGGISTLVLLVAGLLVCAWLVLGSETPRARLVLAAGVLAALVALAGLSAWFLPPLRLAHTRWRLTASGLEIRRGVWFRHWISVPRARVQHTDVERGPLGRRFGLATLVLHTAGHQDSEVRLDGLAHGTALALRDFLLAAEPRGGAGAAGPGPSPGDASGRASDGGAGSATGDGA